VNKPATVRIAIESALCLLVPLFAFKCLSFVPWREYEFTRLYLSTMVGTGAALLCLMSLVRLQLVERAVWYGFVASVVTVLLVTKRGSVATPSPNAGPQLMQFIIVLVVNAALLFGGSCCGMLLALRIRRSSFLIMTALVTCLADTYSVWYGPTGKLVEEHAELVAPRTMLHWFALGHDLAFPFMGVGDLLFLSLFFCGARRYGFDARANVTTQLAALAVAYAIIIGETLAENPVRLAGLMFIGPAFLVVNWGRFELDRNDKRGLACAVAGLTLGLVALIVLQQTFGWLKPD